MDCAVWRVERLHVVKVVWNLPHLDHSVPIVSVQALDFGSSGPPSVFCMQTRPPHNTLPVLEPDLNLPGAQAGNFSRQAFAVCRVGVWLLGEFAHEKTSLLVGKPEGG